MIYAYKYLNHRIEGFHENIMYFFSQLFTYDFKNPFDENILLKKDFIPIANASKVRILENLKLIFETYKNLNPSEKDDVKHAFLSNSDIEKICNDVSGIPVKYEELPSPIADLLKTFFTMLWKEYPQTDLLENNFGTVQEHFNAFISELHQKALICPFCGLHKLKPSGSINRNAYDHYIPKALYPFTSINYNNLFPVCGECNSDEKGVEDTPFDDTKRRRKVFYPFDSNFDHNQLSMAVETQEAYNSNSLKTLLSDIQWEYKITYSATDDPRLVSWDSIFHIKRRYKENILVYQKEWFDEIARLHSREKKKGTPFLQFKNEILEDAKYQVLISPLGMLRFVYFSFLFSNSELENKLNEMAL